MWYKIRLLGSGASEETPSPKQTTWIGDWSPGLLLKAQFSWELSAGDVILMSPKCRDRDHAGRESSSGGYRWQIIGVEVGVTRCLSQYLCRNLLLHYLL